MKLKKILNEKENMKENQHETNWFEIFLFFTLVRNTRQTKIMEKIKS
jgi:hypothetical protein